MFILNNFFGSLLYYWLGLFNLLLGAILVFFPMHIAGLAGMARRIPEYSDIFIPSVTVGTTGSFLLIFSVLILLRSMLMTWTNVIYANYR